MRRALAAAAAIGALAVVAFFVAVPIVIDRNLSAEAVAARGSALLGSPVTVGSVGVAFVPALRIRAEDVAAEGVGSAEAVEVEIAILPLLWRRVEVVELHLRRPRLLLVRGPDGAFRLRLLHAPGRAGGPGGPADLPELEARDGELVAVEADGAPTGAPVLHVERLELGRTLLGRHAALRLDVSLDPGDDGRFGVGRLALRGAFERTAEGVALREARAEGRDLRVRGLRFPSFEGRFDYEAGRARISELSLAGYDGSVSLAGTLRSGQPARFAGHFEARGLSVAAMVEDWRGRPLDHGPGVLDAAGDVDLR
ncbi:MAG TPA: hypothetical protein VKB65_01505, partial [Myxococcota bacterium]|nr:hypothetical protein [Myxococcota bacterium]